MPSRILVPCFALLLLVGCSSDKEDPVAPASALPVVVQGTVTSIQDQTPVDGGVIVDLDVEGGGAERAYFSSLFTTPPPSEDRLRQYDLLRRVEVGDVVRIEGKRDGQEILITSLWILQGSL